MAKVSFNKLGLKAQNNIKTIEINGQNIEIKQYLSVNDKLELIGNVINLSADENNFSNPVKVDVFTGLEIIRAYTNITFTEKQKEDPAKLYDLLIENKILYKIISEIPYDEQEYLFNNIKRCVDSVYNYKNSIMGILETISQDYSNLDLDASEIQKKIGDPENMALLKEILSKLG